MCIKEKKKISLESSLSNLQTFLKSILLFDRREYKPCQTPIKIYGMLYCFNNDQSEYWKLFVFLGQ